MFHNSYKETYSYDKKGRLRKKQDIPGTSVLSVNTDGDSPPKEDLTSNAPGKLGMVMKLEQPPQLKSQKKQKTSPSVSNANVHNWEGQTHLVFALGKNNDLNVRSSVVPGTSKIRISKPKRTKRQKQDLQPSSSKGAVTKVMTTNKK